MYIHMYVSINKQGSVTVRVKITEEDIKNMRDFTKRTIEKMLQEEEQAGPKKPNNIPRPFSQGGASSFRPWQPSWKKGHGFGVASSSDGPHQANINKGDAQDNNDMNIDTLNPDPVEKNPINVIGATSSGAGGDDMAARTDEEQPGSGGNTQTDLDPKRLRRIMANRASARRSRLRKNEYIAELEQKAKSYQDKLCFLHPQIQSHKNHQRMLQIEQHQLKLQMAIREKERILQEVEIEKNRAEVERLSELQRKQIAEAATARMMNRGAAMEIMPNSNLNPYISAQSGVETSRLETDISQQPQNQSQRWMHKWNNG